MDEVRAGRAEASATIWKWRDASGTRTKRAAKARMGGVIRGAVAALVAGLFFYFERPTMSAVVATIGGLTLILALVSPLGAYATLERAIGWLGEWIGRLLTWILLAPVFYLFFFPFGLLFRRGAHDKLQRTIEPDAETYWHKRDGARAIDKPY